MLVSLFYRPLSAEDTNLIQETTLLFNSTKYVVGHPNELLGLKIIWSGGAINKKII